MNGVHSFHKNHPELLDGEMFLTALAEDTFDVFFDHIPYNSKRRGQKCFDNQGNVDQGYVPIFVSIEEYNRMQQQAA